jgi:hypothetical protein
LASLVAWGLIGCGPSFQAVYECDVRFEHCYALDERNTSPDAKKECWREWLHSYTYGQPRDRVEYAATRVSELSLDPMLPSEEAAGARPPRRPTAVAAPVPTNAFAPPPNLAASAAPAASSSAVALREEGPRAPGAECSDGCARRWTSCRETCKEALCAECDRSYRVCVPACFHEDAAAHQPPRSLR